MTDICSIWAYDDIKLSGYVGKRQAQYLHVFTLSSLPLTHREASQLVNKVFSLKVPERNGRIRELEDMGFIEKVDHVICEHTKKTVNRWRYTGRKIPLIDFEKECVCDKCGGTGKVKVKVFRESSTEEIEIKFQENLFE
jgi:hypothetical protein